MASPRWRMSVRLKLTHTLVPRTRTILLFQGITYVAAALISLQVRSVVSNCDGRLRGARATYAGKTEFLSVKRTPTGLSVRPRTREGLGSLTVRMLTRTLKTQSLKFRERANLRGGPDTWTYKMSLISSTRATSEYTNLQSGRDL